MQETQHLFCVLSRGGWGLRATHGVVGFPGGPSTLHEGAYPVHHLREFGLGMGAVVHLWVPWDIRLESSLCHEAAGELKTPAWRDGPPKLLLTPTLTGGPVFAPPPSGRTLDEDLEAKQIFEDLMDEKELNGTVIFPAVAGNNISLPFPSFGL